MNIQAETLIIIVAGLVLVLLLLIIIIASKKKKKKENKPEVEIQTTQTNDTNVTVTNANIKEETPVGISMFDQNINTNINPINQTQETTNTTEVNNVTPIVEQNIQNNNENQPFVYNPGNQQVEIPQQQVPVQESIQMQAVTQPTNSVVTPNVIPNMASNMNQPVMPTPSTNVGVVPQQVNQSGNPNNPMM